MRRDMKRVIIDTGRYESGWPSWASVAKARERALERRSPELLPQREGIKRRLGGGSKWFGDRIGPLIRWLEQQVGRAWDDVWSEICATNDARSIDGWHLREHVETAVKLPSDGPRSRPWQEGPGGLYVDARGVLRQHPLRPRPRVEWHSAPTAPDPDPDRIEVDERLRYERIDGAWYAVERDDRAELSVWDRSRARRARVPLATDDPRRWRKRRLGKRAVQCLRLDEERARRTRSVRA